MNDLKLQYENAKSKALAMMQIGNITDYVLALSEMNHYKRMINAITLN